MAKQLAGFSGGGGVVARPVSYIEITDTGSRYVELSAVKKTIAIVALGICRGLFVLPLPKRGRNRPPV
jgi:hypothetical protein